MVEAASSEELFAEQIHPYTKALLNAVPIPDVNRRRERILLKGEIGSPVDPKAGCRFAPRCGCAVDTCFAANPELLEIGPGRFVKCRLAERSGGAA
jgi:peptide/nickel transport system ATP-binding protein